MTFGLRLRELRKEKSMTQKELAAKAKIDFTYLSKIETGVMPPPRAKTILALAKGLGIDKDAAVVDELYGLAKKIPSDLSKKVTPEMIQMLRLLQDKKIDKPEDWQDAVQKDNAQ